LNLQKIVVVMAFWKARAKVPSAPVFHGPDQSNPETFIRSFCTDYKNWNEFCLSASEAAKSANSKTPFCMLSEKYADFIGLYTQDQTDLQLIAFGTSASFDPDRLIFGNMVVEEDRLRQTFFIELTSTKGSNEYFASLEKLSTGGFRLIQIFYVDPFPEDYPEGKEPILPSL